MNEEEKFSLTYKFSLINPFYFSQSTVSLNLLFNRPPKECALIVNPDEGIALEDPFTISIINCIDQDRPLLYSLYYYEEESKRLTDIDSGQINNAIYLMKNELVNTFKTILPEIPSNFLSMCILDLIIHGQIRDNLGGIANITSAVINMK